MSVKFLPRLQKYFLSVKKTFTFFSILNFISGFKLSTFFKKSNFKKSAPSVDKSTSEGLAGSWELGMG